MATDAVQAALLSDASTHLVSTDVSLDEAVAWYCERFLEEVTSWRTTAEMLDLLGAVKGRRRFQGFGRYYGSRKQSDEGDRQLLTAKPKEVFRASGGAAKGGGKVMLCPICGGKMRFIGIALTTEEAEEWLRGPPVGAGACVV
jgi:hypothetical protein